MCKPIYLIKNNFTNIILQCTQISQKQWQQKEKKLGQHNIEHPC